MVIKSAGGWGETENNLVLEGWLGDRIVCRRKVGESRYAAGITARADDSVLYADGDTYDATRITVKAVDNMGNLLPFTQECVEIQLDGLPGCWALRGSPLPEAYPPSGSGRWGRPARCG